MVKGLLNHRPGSVAAATPPVAPDSNSAVGAYDEKPGLFLDLAMPPAGGRPYPRISVGIDYSGGAKRSDMEKLDMLFLQAQLFEQQ